MSSLFWRKYRNDYQCDLLNSFCFALFYFIYLFLSLAYTSEFLGGVPSKSFSDLPCLTFQDGLDAAL